MLFTPKYTVSYRGVFHTANVPFDIDMKDAEEMRKHGVVEKAPIEVHAEVLANAEVEEPTAQPKKPGRPKKTN